MNMITVKDLIEKLQECNPSALITIDIVKELREDKALESIFDNTSIELVCVSSWTSSLGTSHATLQLGTSRMVSGEDRFTPNMIDGEVML